MNNIDNEALNELVETENNQIATPAVEEETAKEASSASDETTSTEDAENEVVSDEEIEDSTNKGYNARVRQLVKERNMARAEMQSLADKMAALTGQNDLSPQLGGQYRPQVQPGEEITFEQYQQDVLRQADALVELKIKQNTAVQRINNEALESVRDFPELDPNSEAFNSELSETVTEAVEAYVKANPYSASVKQFVGKLMKPYKGAVTKEVGKAKETLAKQVSEAAVKPTSIRPTEKSTAEKSIAELEVELGIIQS